MVRKHVKILILLFIVLLIGTVSYIKACSCYEYVWPGGDCALNCEWPAWIQEMIDDGTLTDASKFVSTIDYQIARCQYSATLYCEHGPFELCSEGYNYEVEDDYCIGAEMGSYQVTKAVANEDSDPCD